MAVSQADLHVHTTASDGTDTPGELVAKASALGLRYVAITDHDTTEGVDEAMLAAAGGSLQVIPGLEMSTDNPDAELHIVAYYIDHRYQPLQRKLRELSESRDTRARRMVELLNQLGCAVSWQRVEEIAGEGVVGRPHVAQALVECGSCVDVNDAFERYLARGRPAYVPRLKVLPVDAVTLIGESGGLAGLAHPVLGIHKDQQTELADLEIVLPPLCEAGLAALECYYTGYSAEITEALLALAERFHLVPTGGSDYHGHGLEGAELGGVYVPLASVERLEQLKQQRRRD